MIHFIATCETQGCENSGVAIDVITDASQIMCGACQVIITNVVEKTNGSTETSE